VKRVVVTGMGVVSAVGNNFDDFGRQLRQEQTELIT